MKDFNLEKQPKIETGHKVPEGYFESFSEKIMSQIASEYSNENSKVVSLFDRNKKWILSIAASFVVMFSINFYFFNLNKKEIEIQEIENYIVQEATITDYDIADLMNENDIKKITIEYKLENQSTENIDLEALNLEENL